MVKHIVVWKLADAAAADENAARMKEKLEALVGVVPGLQTASVHRGFGGWDVCLESTHDSREALEEYQSHPAHLEAKKFVHSVVCDRASCDFDL